MDGKFFCYTLEPARVNPVNAGHPCVVAGTYKVKLTLSPHFHYITPEVLNVLNRTAIRWHIGNKPKDSEGCTLVGISYDTDWVSGSATAFHRLMTILTQADNITVTYTDEPAGA